MTQESLVDVSLHETDNGGWFLIMNTDPKKFNITSNGVLSLRFKNHISQDEALDFQKHFNRLLERIRYQPQ